MKKPLTLLLTFLVLVVFTSPSGAQKSAEQMKAKDKSSPILMEEQQVPDKKRVRGTFEESRKDPCAIVKNDPKKQADCQKAAKLGRRALSGGGGEAKVSVCSGGYWWTGGWGGWTQGGSCSPEGAIK